MSDVLELALTVVGGALVFALWALLFYSVGMGIVLMLTPLA